MFRPDHSNRAVWSIGFAQTTLYRYPPFRVATFLERFVIIAVPLLVVVLPGLKFLPQILEWRVRSRIYRWYGELTLLENDVHSHADDLPIERRLSDLERIRRAAERVTTPASFASESYILREHIDLVCRAVLAKAVAAGRRTEQAETCRSRMASPNLIRGIGGPS